MKKNEKNKWYPRTASQVKFLLGGIGAGNISLGSRGQLCDWEIFNSPNIGYTPVYTFFAIRTQDNDGKVHAKILESEFVPPYEASHGIYSWDSGGVPRFQDSRISGKCSSVVVELFDEDLPVEVSIKGFTPLIPLDADRSGIPALALRYRVKNISDVPLNVSICGNMSNQVGFSGKELFGSPIIEGVPHNELREDKYAAGVFYTNELPCDHLKFGSMALATRQGDGDITIRKQWLNGDWWDGAHDFWDDFTEDGRLEPEAVDHAVSSNLKSDNATLMVGAVCVKKEIAPGEEADFQFVISWYFPNRESKWNGHVFSAGTETNNAIVHNYYVNLFRDAWHAASYLEENLSELEELSGKFEDALYNSDLSVDMLDAVAANITVMRSTTCFRLENGKFFGWEGTFNHRGSCEGNATHVWGYEQAIAFLFPVLEQDMRRTEFLIETDDNGSMAFRTSQALGNKRFELLPPAADGQMECVIRLYRDWKLCGEHSLLEEMWDKVVKVMEFACTHWDTDGDFVFDGMQHNSYDVEFYGLNPFTNVIFFTALLAAAEMADAMNCPDIAEKYRAGAKAGSSKMDAELFNGSYYEQKYTDTARYKYQVGSGCLADQLFGQELAHIAGLGYVLPEAHVRSTLKAVYQHNFKKSLRNHINVQRAYAINDEGGLLLCTWPNGGRPRFPFPYCDEVWSGVEYEVAAEFIYNGFVEEAEEIVRTARSRYDGVKRNPYNEVECGNHYNRTMSSWGLLLAMSGYSYDLTQNEISFEPKVKGDFTCFFSTAKSWGIYTQKVNEQGGLDKKIEVLYGDTNIRLK